MDLPLASIMRDILKSFRSILKQMTGMGDEPMAVAQYSTGRGMATV